MMQIGRFGADVVGDDATLKPPLCGDIDVADVRPFQSGPCGAIRPERDVAECDDAQTAFRATTIFLSLR